MELLQNRDLKRMLIFTVILGFSLGCVYIFALDNYFITKPRFNLEILQNFEIFKDVLKYNSTDILNDKKILQSSGVIHLKRGQEKLSRNVTIDVENDHEKVSDGKATKQTKKQIGKINRVHKQDKHVQKKRVEDKKICRLDRKRLGRMYADVHPVDILTLKDGELKFVKDGGKWEPSDCKPRTELAIVIPYRKRETHLGIFLRHMHKFLKKQMVKYRIFIIEQDDEYEFNRGKLMNVGFREALARNPFNCFAFHDIDLLPEDTRNDYACPGSPRHMSVAIDKFSYELIYPELFGGVEMFQTEDFKMVNGFSNSFWGWGAEDDNLYFRIKMYNLSLTRPSMAIGRYTMLKHLDMERWGAPDRKKILEMSKDIQYIQDDGLSSLQYKVNRVLELPLFTLIKVNLQMHKDRMLGVYEYF